MKKSKPTKGWAITGNGKILCIKDWLFEIYPNRSEAEYNLQFITEFHTKFPPKILPVEIRILPRRKK